MKFLPEFKSCWGGAMVTPAAVNSGSGRRSEETGRYSHNYGPTASKRVAKSTAHNWRPKLNAIYEDRPMSEAAGRGGVNRRTGGSEGNKRPVKVKPKSPARIREEDYWNSAQTIALPAFAPTPVLF